MPDAEFFDESKTTVKVPFGGAKRTYEKIVLPQTQISGNESTLTDLELTFDAQLAANEVVDFSRSYIAIKTTWQMSDGAAAFEDIVDGDDIAPAQFAGALIWNDYKTLINGQQVEQQTVNNPAQQAVLHYLATRSREWLETEDSAGVGQANFEDRQALILGGNTPEIHWYPQSALWGFEKGVRPGSLRVEANLASDWYQRIVESESATLVAGADNAATGYRVAITGFEMRLTCYKKEMKPSASKRVIQLPQMYVRPFDLTSATTFADQVTLPRPAYAAYMLHQTTGAGATSTIPLNEVSNATASSLQLTYQGTNVPSRPLELDFANGKAQRAFEFFRMGTSDKSSGLAIDYTRWASTQTAFYFPLVADSEAGAADRFDITNAYTSAFTGKLYVISIHDSFLAISYNASGMATDIALKNTPAEAAAFLK